MEGYLNLKVLGDFDSANWPDGWNAVDVRPVAGRWWLHVSFKRYSSTCRALCVMTYQAFSSRSVSASMALRLASRNVAEKVPRLILFAMLASVSFKPCFSSRSANSRLSDVSPCQFGL